MANKVAILEDNDDRISKMNVCLAEVLPGATPVFFDNARNMIAWLGNNLTDIILISLDHDLPLRERDGKITDCGNGRMVADFLADQSPICPIIVHSSNTTCAAGMLFALKDAAWPVFQVHRYEGEIWIREARRSQVVQLVQRGWITIV